MIWKYSTKDDAVLGKTTLGYFPATVDITPDGNFLFVVNFNLHGDMVPSSVSVVSTPTMTEAVEGVGSEPGTVEIIDLKAMKTVASIDVGEEAAGIDFFKTESAGLDSATLRRDSLAAQTTRFLC